MLEMLTLTSPTTKKAERITPIAQKTSVQKKGAYHHGDLRAQLVEATRQLVESKGPDNFSVSEACRLAGVSTAAPYRHFNDKQEMLVAVAMDSIQRTTAKMEEVLKPHPPGSLEGIAALGVQYITHAQEEEGVFRLSFGMTRDHRHDDAMVESGKACFGVVVREVTRYLGKPGVDEEAMERAFSLWTMVHGMSFLLIDEKLDAMGMTFDLPALIRENTARILGPKPDA